MAINPAEAVNQSESITTKVERLAKDFYEKLRKTLDDYQEENGDNSGLPGQVEYDLQECWNRFAAENNLHVSEPPTAGTGEWGNSFGFWFNNPEIESVPVYINYEAEIPARYADRLSYENIRKVMEKILEIQKNLPEQV